MAVAYCTEIVLAATIHPSRAPRRPKTAVAVLLLAGLAAAAPVRAACTGDCDGNLVVSVNEVIKSVNIALGQSAISDCPAIDRDGSNGVSIDELLAAVNALLSGCPEAPSPTPSTTRTITATATPSASATPTETATPTPTVTATINQPPVLPTASIYRTYPGFPIRLPIGAVDPEGAALHCSMETLPAGATFDDQANVLSWTPAEDQLGPFYLPYTCADDAAPPASAQGQLTIRVSALDACVVPSCDPATGCTATLLPLTQTCCQNGPVARVAEPVAGCPEGLVLYVGQAAGVDGFGRIQNCDVLFIKNMQQSAAEVQFHVESRCLNTLVFVHMHARLESNSVNPKHKVVFDAEYAPFALEELDDGWDVRRGRRFTVQNPPYFDLQGAEANLTVTLTDSNMLAVTEQVRVRLSFTPQADLPDVDPTPPPTATRTSTPG